MAFVGFTIPKRMAKERADDAAEQRRRGEARGRGAQFRSRSSCKPIEIELCLSKQLSATLLASHDEIASRVAKMRRKFARAIRLRRP